MKRDHNKTVTEAGAFVIVVPSSKQRAIGTATFSKEFGPPRPIRPLTRDELREVNRRLKGASAKHFGAVLAIKSAIDARDAGSLSKAKRRLDIAYALANAEHPRRASSDKRLEQQFDETLARLMGGSPDEARRHFEDEAPSPSASSDVNILFSYEVTRMVDSSAEIVLWYVSGKFIPAIFCHDLETALYVHTFFVAPSGAAGFRICPHCSEQFFQDRPNQDYCRPAHREAHRVARHRAKNKEIKNSGTHKAR